MERDEERTEADPEEERGPEEPAEAQAGEATAEAKTPAKRTAKRMAKPTAGPPQGQRPRHLLTVGISAAVLVLGVVLFVAGFLTHSLLDDDVDLDPIEEDLAALTERVGEIQGILGGAVGDGASPTPAPVVAASADDDPFIGPEDAPVTIIEFSDYQWSFCKRFRDETLDQILETYEGKIRFVYRDFPLTSIHQYAQKAAEATECADDQDKFWEYHDLLFVNQSALDVASLKTYAEQLGLDTDTFNDCLDTGEHTAEVEKDAQDGQSYGATGTPAFFINGRLVSGAIPFEDYPDQSGAMQPGFKSIIDAALEEAE